MMSHVLMCLFPISFLFIAIVVFLYICTIYSVYVCLYDNVKGGQCDEVMLMHVSATCQI